MGYTIGMNKNTTVELTFSTNRFWELSMSDLGYTEGMTEEEFNARFKPKTCSGKIIESMESQHP